MRVCAKLALRRQTAAAPHPWATPTPATHLRSNFVAKGPVRPVVRALVCGGRVQPLLYLLRAIHYLNLALPVGQPFAESHNRDAEA